MKSEKEIPISAGMWHKEAGKEVRIISIEV